MNTEWIVDYRGAVAALLVGVLFLVWGVVFIHGKLLPEWLRKTPYANEDAIISRGDRVTYDSSNQIPVHKLVGWIFVLVALCCIMASGMHVAEINSL